LTILIIAWGLVAFALGVTTKVGPFWLIVAGYASVALHALWHRFVTIPWLGMPMSERRYDEGRLNFVPAEGQEGLSFAIIRRAVAVLAERAGIPAPAVSVMADDRKSGAINLGNERPHGHVMVADVILADRPDVAVAALAHEVAHIALGHHLVLRRIRFAMKVGSTAIFVMVLATAYSAFAEPFVSVGMVLLYGLYFAAAFLGQIVVWALVMRLARTQEYAADERAGQLMDNHLLMANSLFVVATQFDDPSRIGIASATHPSMANRIQRLLRRHREIEAEKHKKNPVDTG
jgi:Zn-dependent protease with chaperone function